MNSSQRALSFLPELKRNKFAWDIRTPKSHPRKTVLVAFDAELQSISNVYFYDVDIVRVRLHKRERERTEYVVNDLNMVKVDQNTFCLLRHIKQQTKSWSGSKYHSSKRFFKTWKNSAIINVIYHYTFNFRRQIQRSSVSNYMISIGAIGWGLSQANLFRLSSGKKESALWDEYI